MSRFAGKAVVATGAGQGIGRAYAHTVADLDGAKAHAVAGEVRGATAVELDVSDRPSAGAMAEAALGAHGRTDVLVNNAAIFSAPARARRDARAGLRSRARAAAGPPGHAGPRAAVRAAFAQRRPMRRPTARPRGVRQHIDKVVGSKRPSEPRA